MWARWSLGALLIGMGVVAVPVSPAAPATPTWKVVSGNASGTAELSSVSCASATSCKAVGRLGNDTATSRTYVESWNGTKWTVQPSPGLRGTWLLAVACVSQSSCQAVGWADNSVNALTERWNGQVWVRVANPLQGATLAQLAGVSCVSGDRCTAVGSRFSDAVGVGTTLVESWNGKAWSIVPSPNRGTADSSLQAVSCVSRQVCIAVGSSYESSSVTTRTLVEKWNGKAWSIVSSPNARPNGFNIFKSVSCASTASCVAVGRHSGGTLIEHWNGRAWRVVPNPTGGKPGSSLEGVSCVTASACQAVGYDGTRTLIESWNGKTWTIKPSPETGAGYHHLLGVKCLSATSCIAVGDGTAIYSYG